MHREKLLEAGIQHTYAVHPGSDTHAFWSAQQDAPDHYDGPGSSLAPAARPRGPRSVGEQRPGRVRL
jgi:hypothetical protein